MEQYNSIQQLLKKEDGQNRKPIYPSTVIQAVFDAKTGASLEAILAQFNSIYVQYQGSPQATRNIIPVEMRRAGLMITYMNMDSETITEKASSAVQKDNDHWGLDVNWSRVDELSLSGDVTVSAQGTWIINGEDTKIPARGSKGDAGLTPWLKTIDNKLHFSYDNTTWEPCSDYLAGYFRFNATSSDSQVGTIGKIQISKDNKTWQDLSPEFRNYLRIQGYVASTSALPSGNPVGTIYGVGPTYDAADTAHTKPIYHIHVFDGAKWVDNGTFTSISAGVVQETGDSETEVMSQKAVTEKLTELGSKLEEGGGLDESQLGEYLTKNNYAKKSDIPSVPTKVSDLENDKSFTTEDFVKDEISKAQLEGGDGSSIDLSNYATKADLEDLRNTQIQHTQIYGLVYTDGDGVPEVVTYTVTYVINGHGSQPSKVSGVTKLPNPLPTLTESGWTFGGWYTDSALTTKAVAGATLSSNATLYAKWTEVESGGGEEPEEPEEPTNPVEVTNLFDKNTMVLNGKEFGLSDGMATNASSRAALIPIEQGVEYAFWAEDKPWTYTSMGGVFLLKADQTKFCKFFIRNSGDSFADQDGLGYTLNADTTGRGWTFTAPEGAAYLALSVCWRGGDDYTDVLMVEVGDTCHDYVAYSESAPAMFALRADEPTEASTEVSNVQDDLSEYEIVKLFNATLRDTVARAQIQALTPTYSVKKWTVLGDSISVNTSHTTKFYHDILGKKYGLDVTNLAQSGSGWQSMTANAMPNIPMDAELITIMIGTNDVSRGWTADENGVCSPIESALLYALKNRPNAKLAVITPVPRGDSAANGKALRNVAKLIVSTCEYYSVPCFNLTTQSGMYPEIAECVGVMYNDSGVHPNLNGQKRMANAIEPFLKTLIS